MQSPDAKNRMKKKKHHRPKGRPEGRSPQGARADNGQRPNVPQQQNQQQQQPSTQKRRDVKVEKLESPEFVYRALPPQPKRTYKVVFYDTHALARADTEQLQKLAESCDQLNIVIRAEGDMDDPQLTPYGKIFAGAAWALIHDRRVEDGWYNQPQ